MTTLAYPLPLADFAASSALKRGAAILAGSLFLALMAQITVPMWPVPMTMQTFAIMLIGAFCGWRLAGETVLAYIAEAAVGLPVLAGGAAGVAKLLGPTGGYILGFLLAAMLIGLLFERGWSRAAPGLVAAFVLGVVVLYLPGLAWLATFVGGDKAVPLGVTPFLAGEAVKLALATAVVVAARRFVARA